MKTLTENINSFDDSYLPLEERWEKLTLANDFMFCRIMHNEKLCTEMIRRILPDIDIGHIEFTQSQRDSKHSPDTRGVRFDVYAKSDNRKIFDCEVQTSDKKDLPRRTRAYHIANGLDALSKKTLKRSGSYSDLPDVFVIFICTFDPFHHDLHKYTFYNTCREVNALNLDDGAVTVFLNAKGKADDVSPELKAFLDFMIGKSSDDDDPFIVELEQQLWEAKRDARFRRDNMLLLTREDEARAEGRAAGHAKGLEEGLARGLEEGLEEGRAKGLAEGLEEGRAKGLAEGLAAGRAEGISIGEERARLTFIDRLIERGMSYDEAAEILRL